MFSQEDGGDIIDNSLSHIASATPIPQNSGASGKFNTCAYRFLSSRQAVLLQCICEWEIVIRFIFFKICNLWFAVNLCHVMIVRGFLYGN